MKKNKEFILYILFVSIVATSIFFSIFNKISSEDIDYVIELDKFNISNDNTNAKDTTEGINKALEYAKNKEYKTVKLPEGHYAIDTSVISPIVLTDGESEWTHNRKGIIMQSDMELIMTGAILEIIPTNDPYYSIFTISNCNNSKLIGGSILGDRNNHDYGMRINDSGDELERGSYDEVTGLYIIDDSMVRTINFIDNFKDESLPEEFFLTVLENTTRNTVDGGVRYIYCYDENDTYLGMATGGNGFISKTTLISGTKKIKVSFKNETRLDAKYYITKELVYPTHEFGAGITIANSNNIEINNVEVKDVIGDCITTIAPPLKVTVDNLKIINCTLENSRRQGISLVATGENYLIKGCSIGKIGGVDPQSGIDIEHYDYVKNVLIEESSFYDNKKWDIINYNGIDIDIKNCNFTGGIASTFGYNMDINNNIFTYSDTEKLDKTFKGTAFLLGSNSDDQNAYFKINDNIIEGYNAEGGNSTSNLDKSEFKNNTIKNSTMKIGANAENNYYENSTIRYTLCNYEYKNEKFINCIIGGENNGDNTSIRYYTNFDMNNCEFLSGNTTVQDTILVKCKIYNDDKTFCKTWGGKYTLNNCTIETRYNNNIPFIESQGAISTFNECDMNLSVTPFVGLNYGDFTMKNCNVQFNNSYIENSEEVKFFTNVYGTSKFEGNIIESGDLDVNIILPD